MGSRQDAPLRHQILSSCKFIDVEFSCRPLRQSETKCSQTFPHVLQPNTSRGLQIPPVTLDLFHDLFHRPQTNQMAQVSMSGHVEHLGSKVSRIFCFQELCTTTASRASRDLSRTEIEAQRASCDRDPFSNVERSWQYCQNIRPASDRDPFSNVLSQQHR